MPTFRDNRPFGSLELLSLHDHLLLRCSSTPEGISTLSNLEEIRSSSSFYFFPFLSLSLFLFFFSLQVEELRILGTSILFVFLSTTRDSIFNIEAIGTFLEEFPEIFPNDACYLSSLLDSSIRARERNG